MNRDNTLEGEAEVGEGVVSKTRLKNEAKALQDFGKELVVLTTANLEKLPLSELTRKAVKDFHKQSGNIARKRHLAYIGKCLRNEDAKTIQKILSGGGFGNEPEKTKLAKKRSENRTESPIRLSTMDDSTVERLLLGNVNLNRQQLRQLVRNVANAKSEQKKSRALQKLQKYIHNNGGS